MKTTKNFFYLQVAVLMMIATSCQKTQFSPTETQQQSSLAIPLDPVIVDPPPPVIKPNPILSSGACNPDSSTTLTSCQKCNVPLTPPPEPQFSQKGAAFLNIMEIGCSIPNGSAPAGYVPPTRAELIQRLNRLSPTLYPDSTMTAQQIDVISRLQGDAKLQKKMFGGLWYQPPYSDHYETYFGVSVAEAVYQICYKNPSSIFTPYNSTPLVSKQYLDCLYSGSSLCTESPAYVAANTYRNQLRNGMRESLTNPYVGSAPTPAKTCNWEKFEGLYEMGGAEQLGKWLVTSQKVSLEVKGAGARCSVITQVPQGSDVPTGEVVMGAYICK